LIVDTSALLAFFDSDEPDYLAVSAVLGGATEPLVVSPYVVAELDYLLSKRTRTDRAALALLDEVARTTYLLAEFGSKDVAAAATVIRHHRDLRVGLADASLVVLAERYGTNRVLTLDERHFRALRVGRRPFVVLPADA